MKPLPQILGRLSTTPFQSYAVSMQQEKSQMAVFAVLLPQPSRCSVGITLKPEEILQALALKQTETDRKHGSNISGESRGAMDGIAALSHLHSSS